MMRGFVMVIFPVTFYWCFGRFDPPTGILMSSIASYLYLTSLEAPRFDPDHGHRFILSGKTPQKSLNFGDSLRRVRLTRGEV